MPHPKAETSAQMLRPLLRGQGDPSNDIGAKRVEEYVFFPGRDDYHVLRPYASLPILIVKIHKVALPEQFFSGRVTFRVFISAVNCPNPAKNAELLARRGVHAVLGRI
ncbi:MAG: hypothetical protein AB6733_07205 [Clostridiaceae bacterium]